MRAALLLSLLLMLLSPLAPAVGAQATGTGAGADHTTTIHQEGAGDVQVCVTGSCQTAPGGRWSQLDLTGLSVIEASDTFAFVIAVAGLTPQGAELAFAESGVYQIFFKNHDRQFRLDVFRTFTGGVTYRATLNALDPARHAYYPITRDAADLEVKEDLAANTITAKVLHRDLLADGFGAVPHPEVPFTGFRVAARAMGNQFGAQRGPAGALKVPIPIATDALPDSGNATTTLPIYYGVQQSGHIRLRSDIPSRSSNGEATTFVYQLHARNLGPTEDRFTLSVSNVPTGWDVRLPAEQVTIPGNGTLHLLVLATTPFSHNHGKAENFQVEARSVSEAGAIGRIQLGVRYTDPPQPAGHHPQLWLHSLPASDDPMASVLSTAFPGDTNADASAFMNAQMEDPNDAKVMVPGNLECLTFGGEPCKEDGVAATPGTPTAHYTWEVPLSPGLDMGLDFDMAGKGASPQAPVLEVSIKNTLPMVAATFGGRILYVPPGGASQDQFGINAVNDTVVAYLETTAPADVQANTDATTYTVAVKPAPGGDFIAYARGASLLMVLELNFTRADAFFGPKDAPLLRSGGTMILPLFEYHDFVDGPVGLSNIELVATTKTDRFVNAGETLVFNMTVVNHGKSADTVLIEVTGNHAPTHADPWARLHLASNPVHLEGGASQQLWISVAVPAGAQSPEAADLVITAVSENDFTQRSLLHLYGVVDTQNDWPNEAHLVPDVEDASAKTPGFGLLAFLAAVGVALVLVNRRRMV